MKYASLLFANPMIESELANTISPHHQISGWIAFDSLTHKSISHGKIVFQINLQDTAGKDESYIIPLPIKTASYLTADANCGKLQLTGIISNISKYHVKYYSDPFSVQKQQ